MANTLTGSPQGMSVRSSDYFSKDSLKKLVDIMSFRQVPADTYLYWDGEQAQQLFYVKDGIVKLTKTTDDGREFILQFCQPGDIFGEPGGFNENTTYSSNALTMENCVIGTIDHRDLRTLLYQQGPLAVEFIEWMGTMHRITHSKFRDFMMYGKNGALCSILIRLSNSYGEPHANGIRVGVRLTNQELANMIGATRESVNRLLVYLRQEKVISMEHGHIIVHDMDYLRDVLHCPLDCPKELCQF